MDRIRQIFDTFSKTRQADPRFLLVFLAWSLGTLALFVVVGLLLGAPVLLGILGVLAALLAGLIVLGRRAQRVALRQIEGTPGAAAAVLQSMRGAWKVTPAIAFNRKEDLVHLVVGRPGVVLVAEGRSPARVKSLLAKERTRVARAAGDVAVTEIVVGDGGGEGEVALRELQFYLAKLPRAVKSKEVGALDRKLTALKQTKPPLPKGPMPRAPKKYR